MSTTTDKRKSRAARTRRKATTKATQSGKKDASSKKSVRKQRSSSKRRSSAEKKTKNLPTTESKSKPDASLYSPVMMSIPDADSDGHTVTVTSYNLLASGLVKRDQYPYASGPALKWKSRQKLFDSEFRALAVGSDVLCLQEVDHYEFWSRLFEELGFASIMTWKPNKVHGCCVAYRTDRLKLKRHEDVNFDDLVDERTSRAARAELQRGIVGQVVALALRGAKNAGVVVTNTHMFWDPEYPYVRLRHAHELLLRAVDLRDSLDKRWPLMMCGDYNTQPDMTLYKLLTFSRSSLPPVSEDLLKVAVDSESSESPPETATSSVVSDDARAKNGVASFGVGRAQQRRQARAAASSSSSSTTSTTSSESRTAPSILALVATGHVARRSRASLRDERRSLRPRQAPLLPPAFAVAAPVFQPLSPRWSDWGRSYSTAATTTATTAVVDSSHHPRFCVYAVSSTATDATDSDDRLVAAVPRARAAEGDDADNVRRRRKKEVDGIFNSFRALPQFVSAYNAYQQLTKVKPAPEWAGEPPYTHFTGDYQGTLDYIFVERKRAKGVTCTLTATAIAKLPSRKDLARHTGLPSDERGSDHLPITATFALGE